MDEGKAAQPLPPRIQQLSTDVVNRIAAGEVIQRPCNAVKELIENSLDAGSTMIQVNLRAGGLKMIQAQDNGHGIQPADLPILCERFTTSKIKEFEDLSHLSTFGFRGEALASLSYVSHLTVTTRPAGRACAYRAQYGDGGRLLSTPRACAGNPGTSIQAEDLFFNVPVRRDALRSPREEFCRIAEVVARYSLHYAGKCGFFLRSLDRKAPGVNSSVSAGAGGGGDLRTTTEWTREEVVRSYFGQNAATDLLPVSHRNHPDASSSSVRLVIDKLGLRFEGLLSNPGKITSEGVPSVQLVLFVNNRLVECASVKRAIEAAYAALLPHRAAQLYVGSGGSKSSSASLFAYVSLELPTASLDVNVHPTKAEVHFLNEMRAQILDSNDHIMRDIFATQMIAPQFLSVLSRNTETPKQDEIVTGLRDAIEQELLNSTGSRSLLLHSLGLSQIDVTMKTTDSQAHSPMGSQSNKSCHSVSSKGQIAAATTTHTPNSSFRPECMVRTDTRVQRLEAFLHPTQSPNEKKRPPSPDVDDSGSEGDPATEFVSFEKFKSPVLKMECKSTVDDIDFEVHSPAEHEIIDVLQKSVSVKPVGTPSSCNNSIEARASSDARNLLRECVFIGCVSRGSIIVQQSTNLLLMRLHPLMKELFYQLMVANFANHGEMVLKKPAHVRTILAIGLRKSLPKTTISEVEAIADKGCSILSKRADMLWEYFSIKFQPDDTGAIYLHGLPILIDRFIPNLNYLPTLLSRFIREVNWNEEGACFETICRLMANFYAKRIKDRLKITPGSSMTGALPTLDSPDSSPCDSDEDKENAARREQAVSWDWTVEHVLLPTIRSVLLPSHTLCFPSGSGKSQSLLKLTSLPDLYKVFERC